MTIPNTNDGSTEAPRLKVFINTDNLLDLRTDSLWKASDDLRRYDSLIEHGFEGVQIYPEEAQPERKHFPVCTLGRISTPREADPVVSAIANRGYECLTVHAGWGIEEDDAMFYLVESILQSSEKHKIPVYIETHRATITQDMWRTVQITKKFPEVRFNGDLSHYYCGQEMVYGGMKMKLDFMAPIFDRISFMHARIASPGQIQAAIGSIVGKPLFATGDVDYLEDFKLMWTRAMRGWLKNAKPGDYLIFCPELLSRKYYYAKTFQDAKHQFVEESDRFAEAKLYQQIARECFAKASLPETLDLLQ